MCDLSVDRLGMIFALLGEGQKRIEGDRLNLIRRIAGDDLLAASVAAGAEFINRDGTADIPAIEQRLAEILWEERNSEQG